MTTALVAMDDVLAMHARILLLLHDRASAGPWDVARGWVVAPHGTLAESRWPDDPDGYAYYGGNLICESVAAPDALFIAMARNTAPQIAGALLRLIETCQELQSTVRRLERDRVHLERLRQQFVPAGVVSVRRAENGDLEASRTYVRRLGTFTTMSAVQRAADAGV